MQINKPGMWRSRSRLRAAHITAGAKPAVAVFLLLLALICSSAVSADDPMPNFVRFDEDGHGGGQMQSAVAHYVNEDGVSVDLLSTMHIGDRTFFRDLSKMFPKYDAVLYELVAHRGEEANEEGVNEQQKRIADDCDLENQGPHMNYDRPNFVHADLDLEDIEKLEIARHGTFEGALGEGPGLKAARGTQDTAGDARIFADLQAAKKANPAERVRLLRRAYARQLVETAQPAEGETYPAGMEVLVGARNQRVMKILSDQMSHGKKKLAIFYGAAHMMDLEHRLLQMGFKRQSVDWMTAWKVAPDGTPTTRPSVNSKSRTKTPAQ